MNASTNSQIDPVLMQVGDLVFWEEFNQRERPGDRYVVLDTKKSEVVAQNVKIIRDMQKVKAD